MGYNSAWRTMLGPSRNGQTMPFAILNGVRIHYEVAGSGHPIVLLHGHCLDSRMWQGQVAAIASSYTVVTCDLRGHGLSDAPATGYSVANYVEELYQLVLHLGLTKPSLAGHSMGGGIALEYALRHPERISTLALVNSGLEGFSYLEDFSEVVFKQKALLRTEGLSRKFLRVALIGPVFDGVRGQPEKLDLARSMISTWSGASWRDNAVYQPSPKPHIDRLGELRVPTLVAVGESDAESFREIAAVLAEKILVVRKAIVPQAGHLAPLENPDAFNDILLDFLGGAVGKALL